MDYNMILLTLLVVAVLFMVDQNDRWRKETEAREAERTRLEELKQDKKNREAAKSKPHSVDLEFDLEA
jgi:uncharacterized membrane protein YhiD involved in acid resistance